MVMEYNLFGTRISCSLSHLSYGLKKIILVSISGRSKGGGGLFSKMLQTKCESHLVSYSVAYKSLFPRRYSDLAASFIIYRHKVLILKMGGAMLLVSLMPSGRGA
jgi:hypothetical protein